MKINFTKKQYESLAKIVYLGNWMANAQMRKGLAQKMIQGYKNMMK